MQGTVRVPGPAPCLAGEASHNHGRRCHTSYFGDCMTPWQPSTCPRWRPTKYARIRQLVQISRSTSFLRSTAFLSSKSVFAPQLIHSFAKPACHSFSATVETVPRVPFLSVVSFPTRSLRITAWKLPFPFACLSFISHSLLPFKRYRETTLTARIIGKE